jgi:hypothetical protein
MKGKIGEVLEGRSSAGELSVEQQRQEKRFKATCSAIFGAINPDTGTSFIGVMSRLKGDWSIRQDDIKPAIWHLLDVDSSSVDGRYLALDWDGKLQIRQTEEAAKKDNASR